MKLRQQYTFWYIQFEMLSVMAVFQIIMYLIVYHCHFFVTYLCSIPDVMV